ncbi:MAG: glycosyltransferase family 2 protein [Verrucomicrobiota bacterium]
MNWQAECLVIIPCLNECVAIGDLVHTVRRQLPAVLVVDDGSTDATGQIAKSAGAEVLRHSEPLGKGAALQAGCAWARKRGFKWALLMDGDGQHSPVDIGKFLECAETTSADLVIGNRMGNPGQMPWLRRIVNRWMSRRISKAAGFSLPDSQCGFRLIQLAAWAALPIATAHFEIESEVLLGAARAGLRIQFVPIAVIYKTEQSKIHPWQDTVRWFRWWRKFT